MMLHHDRETVTLNIGLENNPVLAKMSAKEIAEYMHWFLDAKQPHTSIRDYTTVGVIIVNPREDTSNATERTAVVEYSGEDVVPGLLARALDSLCEITGQEAIAAWIDHDDGREPSKGFLAGPKADAWGPFNPSKFEIGDANRGSWTFSEVLEHAT